MGETQVVDIPLAGGYKQRVAEPWLDGSSATTVQNAVWIKANAVEKRPGYLALSKATLFNSAFTWAPATVTNIAGVMPNPAGGLAATDGNYLYNVDESTGTNEYLDLVSPCVCSRATVSASPGNARNQDVAEWSGGLRVYVWEDQEASIPANGSTVYYSIVNVATGAIVSTGWINQALQGTRPKIKIMGAYAVVFVQMTAGGSTPGELHYVTLNLAGVAAGATWSGIGVLIADLAGAWDIAIPDAGDGPTTFHIALVYETTTGPAPWVKVRTYSKTNAVSALSFVATATLSGETGQGLTTIGARWNGTQNVLWVGYAYGITPRLVQAGAFNMPALTVALGPVTLHNAATGSHDVAQLGIEDITQAGSGVTKAFYSWYDSDGILTQWTTLTLISGTHPTAQNSYWTQLLSRPFAVATSDTDPNLRVFQWVADTQVQQSQFLIEIPLHDGQLRPVGIVAPRISYFAPAGSDPGQRDGNTLTNVTNEGNRLATNRISAGVITQTANEPSDQSVLELRANFTHPGRYSTASLGGLTYMGGGLPGVFDAVNAVESGTLYESDINQATATNAGAGPLTASKPYSWIWVPEWRDKQGNRHQGQPSAPISFSIPASAGGAVQLKTPTVTITQKGLESRIALSGQSRMYLVPYRTAIVSGSQTSTYFRVCGDLPPDVLVNNPTQQFVMFTDNVADTVITQNELLYTTGGVVEADVPSSFLDVCEHNNRIYGIGDDGMTIWISTEVVPGVPVRFNDGAQLSVVGLGELTAIWGMDDKLFFASKDAIAYVVGSGPNIAGAQSDLSPVVQLPTNVGVVDPRAVFVTDNGTVFRHRYGLGLIDRSLAVHTDFGDPVIDLLASYVTTTAILSHPTRPEMLVCCGNVGQGDTGVGVILSYNTRFNAWSDHYIHDPNYFGAGVPNAALISNGAFYFGDEFGQLYREKASTDALPYYDTNGVTNSWVALDLATGWIKPGVKADGAGALAGFGRVNRTQLTLEVLDWSNITCEIFYDYGTNVTAPSSWAFTSTQISAFSDVGGSTQSVTRLELLPPRAQCASFRMRFTDSAPSGSPAATTGQSYRVLALSANIGPLGGLNRVAAANRG